MEGGEGNEERLSRFGRVDPTSPKFSSLPLTLPLLRPQNLIMDLAAEQDSPGRFDSPQAGRWAEAKGRAQADQPSAAQLDSALTCALNSSNKRDFT